MGDIIALNTNTFNLVEIEGLNDGLLLPWFDLYETLFPSNERMLVSAQIGALQARMRGEETHDHLLAAVNDQQELIGMIHYLLVPESEVACLWYFAIRSNLHSQGLGSAMFRRLCDHLQPLNIRAMLFEVEIPAQAETPEQHELAIRRITFYRRLGAHVLTGIDYLQDIGWHQPPTPMYLMVYPLRPLDAPQALELAEAVFEGYVKQTGPLALE